MQLSPAVVVAVCALPVSAFAQQLGGVADARLSEASVEAVVSILESSDQNAPPPIICAASPGQNAGIGFLTEQIRPDRAEYILGDRWSSTALEGGGLNDGDPTVVTYSFLPDGTQTDGEGLSDMQSFLNSVIGPGQWQPLVQQALDAWGATTGLTFVLDNDDGVPQSSGNTGIAGVRGDIRIGGSFIDGNGGVLAFNYFPNHGDMVIDTGDSNIYGNPANNFRAFRNIIAHEVGHGIALSHIESSSDNFLMEPFLATSFDGPQIDDIRGGQAGYGDFNEHNDSFAQATPVGGPPLASGDVLTLDGRSLDGPTDDDFFSFTTTGSVTAELTLTPRGGQYMQGAQGGGQSLFDADARIDLALAVANSGQSTIASADANGLGGSETLTVDLVGPGPHYAIIDGGDGSTQLYTLEISFSGGAAPCSDADLAEPFGALDFNDVVAFLNAFSASAPSADLAPPMGAFDFNDVVAYLNLFAAGCP